MCWIIRHSRLCEPAHAAEESSKIIVKISETHSGPIA